MIRVVPTNTTGTVNVTSAGTNSFVSTSSKNEKNIVHSTTNEAYYYYNLALQSANSASQSAQNAENYYNSVKNLKLQSDWNETDTTSEAYIQNKPTIGNGTITFIQGGATKGTFTANASSDVTIDLDAGGGGTWGSITGTLSDQTDLQNALNAKQNTLTAGDNIYFTTTVGLPASYTEIVSVTNAVNTYVDTGVRISADNAVMEIRFSITSASASGSFYLWQQRSSTSGNILGLSGSATGSTLGMSVNGSSIVSDITRVAGHTYFMRATYNNGNGTLYVKDETTGTEATNTGTYTFATVNKNLFMFGNGLNTSQTAGAGVTVYYASLTVNGSKKFESCFAKNSSDVVGIYDTVGRVFRTAGIGSLTAGADSDKSKDVIYAGGFLKNTATGGNSLTVGGVASANTSAVNVGGNSSTSGAYSVAIGHSAKSGGQYSTAVGELAVATGNGSVALGRQTSSSATNSISIGINSTASADHSIQLGYGTNSTASTLAVGFNGTNYQLLNGTTGKIPNARLNLDSTPTSASDNAITSGAVYTALSGKADTDLSNLTSTSSTNFDGQWVDSQLVLINGTLAVGSYSYDLSAYLPDDNYSYEIMVNVYANDDHTSSTTNGWLMVGTVASPYDNDCIRISVVTDTYADKSSVCGILPINTGRKIYAQVYSRAMSEGLIIRCMGYRRIGTNT